MGVRARTCIYDIGSFIGGCDRDISGSNTSAAATRLSPVGLLAAARPTRTRWRKISGWFFFLFHCRGVVFVCTRAFAKSARVCVCVCVLLGFFCRFFLTIGDYGDWKEVGGCLDVSLLCFSLVATPEEAPLEVDAHALCPQPKPGVSF